MQEFSPDQELLNFASSISKNAYLMCIGTHKSAKGKYAIEVRKDDGFSSAPIGMMHLTGEMFLYQKSCELGNFSEDFIFFQIMWLHCVCTMENENKNTMIKYTAADSEIIKYLGIYYGWSSIRLSEVFKRFLSEGYKDEYYRNRLSKIADLIIKFKIK